MFEEKKPVALLFLLYCFLVYGGVYFGFGFVLNKTSFFLLL